ncbi:MAG: hypothetical protein ACKV0T_16640 [Planctomycetales bacterium]
MDDTITVREAYIAMFAFLDDLYTRYGFDQLGGLLGGMSLLPDGSSADSAMWDDWMQCVQRSKEGTVNPCLHLSDGGIGGGV